MRVQLGVEQIYLLLRRCQLQLEKAFHRRHLRRASTMLTEMNALQDHDFASRGRGRRAKERKERREERGGKERGGTMWCNALPYMGVALDQAVDIRDGLHSPLE